MHSLSWVPRLSHSITCWETVAGDTVLVSPWLQPSGVTSSTITIDLVQLMLGLLLKVSHPGRNSVKPPALQRCMLPPGPSSHPLGVITVTPHTAFRGVFLKDTSSPVTHLLNLFQWLLLLLRTKCKFLSIVYKALGPSGLTSFPPLPISHSLWPGNTKLLSSPFPGPCPHHAASPP